MNRRRNNAIYTHWDWLRQREKVMADAVIVNLTLIDRYPRRSKPPHLAPSWRGKINRGGGSHDEACP